MARGGDPFLSPEQVLARFSGGPNSGVFTDGSCEGNPGPGGYGWVWVEDGQIREWRDPLECREAVASCVQLNGAHRVVGGVGYDGRRAEE